LERDRVWVLTETFKRGRNEEEDNLWYVAVTRARKDLRLVEKTAA
jgi:ATP-dependent exoDNAse (exonuclease V) beta subunit